MAEKVFEWVGHFSAVSCVALGRRSFEVVASGGEDKRVNVWRVSDGNPPSTMCALGGSSSAISCVALNEEETEVVAGARGGGLRVYDIRGARTKRAMSGHRNRVNDVRCHPFGDFVASGGADACVKIWDARRKACIQSYKGQGGEVEVVRFSPDGKWVASCARGSGQQAGFIKIWDLTAGKSLASVPVALERPKVYATHVEFSPREFVLAAAGSDRVLRLYDLENFERIAATPAADSAFKGLAFSPSGRSVVGVTDQGARQWTKWDAKNPSLAVFENTNWDQVKAMAIQQKGQHQSCLAASFAGNFISLWNCDIDDDLQEEDEEQKDDEEQRPIEILRRLRSSSRRVSADIDDAPPALEEKYDSSKRRQSDDAKGADSEQQRVLKSHPEGDDNSVHAQPKASPKAAASSSKETTLFHTAVEDKEENRNKENQRLDDTGNLLTEMLLGRSTSRALEARLEALEAAGKLWAAGQVSAALGRVRDACSSLPLADLDVVGKWCLLSDFLSIVDIIDDLDHVVDLLAIVADLVDDYAKRAKNDEPLEAPASAAKHLTSALGTVLRAADLFADYVAATLDAAVLGVDLARDERRTKCDKAKRRFLNIGIHLATLRQAFGGSKYREFPLIFKKSRFFTTGRLDDVALRLESKLRASFRSSR